MSQPVRLYLPAVPYSCKCFQFRPIDSGANVFVWVARFFDDFISLFTARQVYPIHFAHLGCGAVLDKNVL